MRKLTPEDLKAIDRAVASIADRVGPEDRFDCRQDLSISLLQRSERPENVPDWLRGAALKWALAFSEERKIRERTEREYHIGTRKRYKRGAIWQPKWWPPHPDAVEWAPLACAGARLIHC